MKIVNKIIFGILLITACAIAGIGQEKAGDKGAPASSQTTSSNSANLPNGWQVYNLGSKDTFKVAMPAKPGVESQSIKTGDSTAKVSYYTASSNDILTVIADISNLPLTADRMSEDTKLYLFKKVREGLVEGMRSELDKNGVKTEIKFGTQKNVTVKGASGYEQDMNVGPFAGRARMLSVKDHIYIFFTLLLEESQESLMGGFLDSFEYTGAK